MAIPHTIVVLGFSAVEREALASCIRLADNREPRYELLPLLTDAELLIVDADDQPAVELVSSLERLEDCVFIGATAPPGAGHRLARPIDPHQLMRHLDAIVAARQPLPAPGEDAGRPPRAIQPTRRGLPLLPGVDLELGFETPDPTEPRSTNVPEATPAPADALALPPAQPLAQAQAAPLAPTQASTPAPMPEASGEEDLPPLDLHLVAELMPVGVPPADPSPELSLLQPSTPAVAPPPVRQRPTPARPPAPATQPAGPSPAKAATPMPVRALVVDDSELAQRFMLTRLERFGLLVDCTGRSDVALSMLARRSHDFVFLDMELGYASPLDGLTLCQQIRREQASRVPPSVIVIVTAHTGELDRVRAMLAGCDAFLGKPLDEHELERLLARHGLVRRPGARLS